MDINNWEASILELESLMDKYMQISDLVRNRLQEIVSDFESLLKDEYDNDIKAKDIVTYDKLLLLEKSLHKYFVPMEIVPDIIREIYHYAAHCQYMRDTKEYGRALTNEVKRSVPKPNAGQSVAAIAANLSDEQKALLREMLKKQGA